MNVVEAPSGFGSGSSDGASKAAPIADAIIRWTLLAMAALMPVFFLPWTIEVLEINKQLLLFVGAGVLGLAWLGKMLADKKFEYRKSWVNHFVLLYVVVYGFSAWFSQNRYMSMVGDFGQEMSGFFSVLAMVVVYFVVVNNIRTVRGLHEMLSAIMVGGFLTAVYGLTQGLGLFVLPFEFTKANSFNTVGTVASMGMYLAFVVTLMGGMLLMGHKQSETNKRKMFVMNALMVGTSVISLVLIAAIDFWPINASLLVASLVLIGFAFVHAKSMKGFNGVLLPIAAVIVSLMLLVADLPITFGYPAEVMPSMKASMDISMQTLRESPILGSGPGTFILDYAKHRSPEVNLSQFWNIRFDRGSSHFLTSLATTGVLGTISWLLVALFLLATAVMKLLKADEKTWHMLVGMFAAWFLLVMGKFVYSSTLTLEFMFWLTMGLLVIVHHKDWYTAKFDDSPRSAMVLSFVFILSIVFAISGLFVEGQRYAGEVMYASAIRADRADVSTDEVLQDLVSAADLNQSNDVYVRNLALGMLVKANDFLNEPLGLEPGEDESEEAFVARQQGAAQERLRQATVMTANAVNTAKHATTIAENNVANWAVLASIYQSLLGVTEGADNWAVDSYEHAIALEPANPEHHTELGKVYVWQSDVVFSEGNAEGVEEEVKTAKTEEADALLEKAVSEFEQAADLKGDYASAHYNLGLALDRQGKLPEAIARMEAVVTLNPQDVGVGFQLSLLYFRNEQKDEAVRLMESVLALSPEYSNAMWYLAAMYEDTERLDDAIAMIQKVAVLNPENELVGQKLEQLSAAKAGPPADVVPPVEGAEGEGGEVLPEPVEQPVENPNEPGVTP